MDRGLFPTYYMHLEKDENRKVGEVVLILRWKEACCRGGGGNGLKNRGGGGTSLRPSQQERGCTYEFPVPCSHCLQRGPSLIVKIHPHPRKKSFIQES